MPTLITDIGGTLFFLIAKLVGILIFPPAAAFFLIVAALVLATSNRVKLAWFSAVSASAILAIAIFTPAGMALILPLEQRFKRAELPEKIDGIVCLGGGVESIISSQRNIVEMANAGDRLYETALLAKRFPEAKVVYSGSSTILYGNTINEGAEIAKKYLQSLGIEPARITLETKSRNTDENVRFSKELIKPSPDQTWVLVTSAFHMPRSIALFRTHKWDVLPWPSDYRSFGPQAATKFTSDYTSNLETMSVALREWIGIISYRLTGKTDVLLPEGNH